MSTFYSSRPDNDEVTVSTGSPVVKITTTVFTLGMSQAGRSGFGLEVGIARWVNIRLIFICFS